MPLYLNIFVLLINWKQFVCRSEERRNDRDCTTVYLCKLAEKYRGENIEQKNVFYREFKKLFEGESPDKQTFPLNSRAAYKSSVKLVDLR